MLRHTWSLIVAALCITGLMCCQAQQASNDPTEASLVGDGQSASADVQPPLPDVQDAAAPVGQGATVTDTSDEPPGTAEVEAPAESGPPAGQVETDEGPDVLTTDDLAGVPVKLLWEKKLSTDKDEYAADVAVDHEGNCYVLATTLGQLGDEAFGGRDVFLAKYDPDGAQLWARQIGTSEWDTAAAVALDDDGNCFVAAYTMGSLAAPNAGYDDWVLLKYDREGDLLWQRQVGTRFSENVSDIAVDAVGSCYLCGEVYNRPRGEGVGPADTFVAKYTGDGVQVWSHQFGSSSGSSTPGGIAVTDDGVIYVVGETSATGRGDVLILYLNNEGDLLSSEEFGTAWPDGAHAVDVDAEGNYYIAGTTEGDLAADISGKRDVFIAKYNANRVRKWIVQTGTGEHDMPLSLAVDDGGNLYVVGRTASALADDGDENYDVFLLKYDGQGRQRWKVQFGTSEYESARAIAMDADGRCYVVGTTGGSRVHNPRGQSDAFIIVLRPTDESSDGGPADDEPTEASPKPAEEKTGSNDALATD